ncbi:MAG: hypothetical protein WHT06_08950 [Desulfobacterales bacterium]
MIFLRRWSLPVLRAAALLTALSAAAAAASAAADNASPAAVVEHLDPEECAPFEIVGTIMEVHPERGVIVVAEREIRGLNAAIGGKTVQTHYLDEAGKPRARKEFRKGETVAVEGFRHPDGHVAALRLQKLEKRPPAPRASFQPVEEARRKFPRGR